MTTAAKALGMTTLLVGDSPAPTESAGDGTDIRIPEILHLADAIRPWLTS